MIRYTKDCVEFFCDSNGGLCLVFELETQREIDFEVWKTLKIETLISMLNIPKLSARAHTQLFSLIFYNFSIRFLL